MSSTDSADMRTAAAKFFTASHFAVAGASSQPHKFGHRIFAWYLDHNLSAIPLNPTAPEVTVSGKQYKTVSSPKEISDPSNTSLSVITPPKVTAKLLEEAKAVGVKAVWLQPGAFTQNEMDYALQEFPGAVIGGFAEGTVGGEGWCVLVDGDAAMDAAAKLKDNKQHIEKSEKRQVDHHHRQHSSSLRGETFSIPFL